RAGGADRLPGPGERRRLRTGNEGRSVWPTRLLTTFSRRRRGRSGSGAGCHLHAADLRVLAASHRARRGARARPGRRQDEWLSAVEETAVLDPFGWRPASAPRLTPPIGGNQRCDAGIMLVEDSARRTRGEVCTATSPRAVLAHPG